MTIDVRAGRRTRSSRAGLAAALAAMTLTVGAATVPEPLTKVPMKASGDWDYRLDAEGRLWLAYYDESRILRVRQPNGEEQPVVPEGREQAPSGLAMAVMEDGAALLWRDKVPQKGLYFANTARLDQVPLELAGESQPLVRFHAAMAGDRLNVLWYGEQPIEGSSDRYHLFYRQVDPSNGTSSPVERVLPGVYPVWATDERGGVMVFSWLAADTPQRIVSRFRADGADVFGDTVTIAEVPGITPIFQAFRSGNRWIVVWLSQYGEDRTDFLLEGARSDDEGKTWTAFAFEDLRGFDLGSLEAVADASGHILISVTARTRADEDDKKHNVYILRSADRGTTWSAVQPLRPPGALDEYRARNPSVAFGDKPGQVFVVWEDWREIRSRLYASLSTDYGETWKVDNVRLPFSPGTNLRLTSKRNTAYHQGDRFNVIAEQALDDALASKHLVQLGFTADEFASLATADKKGEPAEPDSAGAAPEADVRSEAGLRARINGFWQALVDKNFEVTYSMQDPFFRARNSWLSYERNMGKILYSSFNVAEVKIDGPKAEVKTTIRASIPPFRAQTGEMISRPEEEITVDEVWLWVDDGWYREFRSEAQELKFTEY
ncbi:sialidase family protein [Thiocapsa rosea]|uniref:BNR repeat protein n=1 Tax=Thiocapsa rosea TaxID=69360 RepID=A0A495V7Y8_9GAMM|nr:sialidase family protein [Thiocapsa rosea]RKT44477.1 BNR repeat protein [Thiocapsa rosea]